MNTSTNFVILIAEDDEDDRFLLTQAFDKQQPNCRLHFFHDGKQLLEALTQPESNTLPAFILLDLNMPILDGLATLKQLKTHPRLRSIPVLMLTTSNHEDDIKRCYEAGANAYMTKPATYTELANQIGSTLQYWLQTAQLPSGS